MEQETKSIGITALLTVLITGMLGGIIYTVYDTGEELTCRTNKPFGWVIDNTLNINGIDVYLAHCPYTTQEWVYANCSSFRSTGSYERYGCNEVIVIAEEPIHTPTPLPVSSNSTSVWCCPPSAECYAGKCKIQEE